jgi:protoporphyrinogen oxidase
MTLTADESKRAIIIGAGPAGLTAAFEMLTRTGIVPIVLEKTDYLGGISRTVNYKGNRIDIGGHRFFSKSDRVMQWWLNILPMQATDGSSKITYQRQTTTVPAPIRTADPAKDDNVMLVRHRKSRIYFMRQFFDYPITLSADTLRRLGFSKTMRIGFSYLHAVLFPIKNEQNLEQFFINRFGRELYLTFFKSYTEKVWGIQCNQISAEWGAQRIKGLSIYKTVLHVLKKLVPKKKEDIAQKDVETSLIEQFLYPKYGPGQMWEEVAKKVQSLGGRIHMHWSVEEIEHDGNTVTAVVARNTQSGELQRFRGDYFFSTMPVKELVAQMNPPAPAEIREISDGLMYRDFITVGVLCDRIKLKETSGELVKDNWIYIQEPDVLVGRLQIFNNWSPSMVADPSKVWIGLEYFCNEGDGLWQRTDAEMIDLAKQELASMNILDPENVFDATVIRMPKTYPAYFGSYDRFGEVISWANEFDNLFLVGRNGMHKYNNQDHSMLTAMTAVDNIIGKVRSRENLWALNTEQEYHEAKETPSVEKREPEPVST